MRRIYIACPYCGESKFIEIESVDNDKELGGVCTVCANVYILVYFGERAKAEGDLSPVWESEQFFEDFDCQIRPYNLTQDIISKYGKRFE